MGRAPQARHVSSFQVRVSNMMPTESSQNSIILDVQGLTKHFPIRSGFWQKVTGWVRAVNGVDFKIAAGRTLGLVGESGCGKSTVARMILKLLEPDSGKIVYRDQDISRVSGKEMKPFRRKIQIVFQDPYGSLNPRMTIGQSVEEGLRILGVPKGRQRRDRLEELLNMVGLSADSADRYPHEFSGGQRQRVGIARALSVNPSLVICDEPISALDVSIQAQIINLLNDLQQRLELSYLFISHDLNVVGYLCNDVAVMYNGYIMEYAATETLFESPVHPYTQSLLAAVPEPDPDLRKKEIPIRDTEVLKPPPEGCVFSDRCPLGDAECRRRSLELRQMGPNHWVRCWKADDTGQMQLTPHARI
jgi:oligopeptide/dipeptide ABC transporter ATP-binding protein